MVSHARMQHDVLELELLPMSGGSTFLQAFHDGDAEAHPFVAHVTSELLSWLIY